MDKFSGKTRLIEDNYLIIQSKKKERKRKERQKKLKLKEVSEEFTHKKASEFKDTSTREQIIRWPITITDSLILTNIRWVLYSNSSCSR